MVKEINGMSILRNAVVNFMESNDFFTKLEKDDWYKAEDGICEFIENFLKIKPNEPIFSQCDKAISDDIPTTFEESVYRRIDRYYHKTDILDAISCDQEQRNWEGVPRLVYHVHDIETLVDEYENNITGEENLQISRDTLLDYQTHHIFEEEV